MVDAMTTKATSAVGVDIGCGMEVVRVEERRLECAKLDKLIREGIPSGFEIRKTPHPFAGNVAVDRLRCAASVNLDRARRSVGTLGGGNHFIEANRDDEGNLYVVVHSGSRHLGLEVANLYQKEGYRQLNSNTSFDRQALIDEYRKQDREKEIQKVIAATKKQVLTDIPPALAYVSGPLFLDYLHDMKLVQEFAQWNRKAIMREIVKGMKLTVVEQFTTVHNYIDTDEKVLRKGAVSAKKGEKLLIPMNMRDGSLICIGKGNEDWNRSAPHGAGRLMSRTQAKNSFSLTEFRKSMEGIFTTSVSRETLDEAPMAYKPMKNILSAIAETVDIERRIVPLYNFKAAE